MRLLVAATLLAVAHRTPLAAQGTPIPLWPAGAPGAPAAPGADTLDAPTITPFVPAPGTANGTAIVIFPGGGYSHLAFDKEGTVPARRLAAQGVAAFVVRYRLGPRHHAPAMPDDASRAVRLVRARAAEWGIDARRIGVMGFSAGGHMASVAATHFDAGVAGAADAVERASSRPDFAILVYPVITMRDPWAHRGSRTMLLGEHPDSAAVARWSSELQVRPDSPPTFLVATSDDAVVPVENAILMYQALHAARIPAELHVYQSGPHGFGLAPADSVLSTWPDRAAAWMRRNGWLPAPATR